MPRLERVRWSSKSVRRLSRMKSEISIISLASSGLMVPTVTSLRLAVDRQEDAFGADGLEQRTHLLRRAGNAQLPAGILDAAELADAVHEPRARLRDILDAVEGVHLGQGRTDDGGLFNKLDALIC